MSGTTKLAKDIVEILAADDSPTPAVALSFILEQGKVSLWALQEGQASSGQFERLPARVNHQRDRQAGMNGCEFCQRILNKPRHIATRTSTNHEREADHER